METHNISIIGWFARNPVAANLLMAFFIFAGIVTAFVIRQEFIPDFQTNLIRITIVYPEAPAEEVEKQLCRKVETALTGTKGIKRLRSVATEGVGFITAETLLRSDANEVRERIRQVVDGITTLPKQAEKPTIQIVSIEEPVLWVVIAGNMGERSLKTLSKQIHSELLNLEQISKASLHGVRDEEIAIEVEDNSLLRYNLTISDIVDAIRLSSLDMVIGAIRSEQGEVLLRTASNAASQTDFENIIISQTPDGSILRLSDIADIKDGFEETNWFLRYQGRKAAGIQVFRVGHQSIQNVAKAVHSYIERKNPSLPEGVRLAVIGDTSVPLKDQMSMMLKNVASGGLLVFIALTLFLRFRVAFWVVAGMPVCFLGALWLMSLSCFDLSVNMLTLFGFILVIGIVVDDAIIIGESIHTVSEKKGYSIASVIHGAERVSLPATFGVLTTVAAFLPILMLPGVDGKLWMNIAWVVIFCLLLSLTESKLILPAHLAGMSVSRKSGMNCFLNIIQKKVDQSLKFLIDRLYRPTLHSALRWRYSVVALFIAVAILTVGMVGGGIIRLVFFPEFEADTLDVQLTMVGGSPFEKTREMVSRIESGVDIVNKIVKKQYGTNEDVIHHFVSFSTSDTSARFYAELVPVHNRPLSAKEISKLWRESVSELPGVQRLVFSDAEEGHEAPVVIQLSGENEVMVNQAAGDVKTYLEAIAGTYDVHDSLDLGKKEMQLTLLPGMEFFGPRLGDISIQLQQALHGEKVQTLLRNGEEVDVYVRYPAKQRDSLGDLRSMHFSAQKSKVQFSNVAKTEPLNSQKEIQRVDCKRIVTVTADVDPRRIEPHLVIKDLKETILRTITEKYPGVKHRFGGQQEGQDESIAAMITGSLYALFVIFALMAIPLNSYFQPLLIMTAIPFGIIGALWGHWFLGMPVSVLSLCGIIALSGVVVNDSLVLVDFVNRYKRTTGSPVKAVCKAGPARLRAILLTSLTTFIGLVPMMLEKNMQAQFLIPMAVSLAFGILFATVITLYLIPSLYLITNDIALLSHYLRKTGRKQASAEVTGYIENLQQIDTLTKP